MIFLLCFCPKLDFGYTLEPPRRGGSNEYSQSMLWIKNKEKMDTPVNPILLYKSGVQRVYIIWTLSPDVLFYLLFIDTLNIVTFILNTTQNFVLILEYNFSLQNYKSFIDLTKP